MNFLDLPEDHQAILGPLFDPRNELSLANLLPGRWPGMLLDLVSRDPGLLILLSDEEALLDTLKAQFSYSPTVTDHRLRHQFWLEFENAILENRQMVTTNIHSLVCNENAFRVLFLKQAHRASFLLCKPAGYKAAMEEMLIHSAKQLRRILDMPEIDAKGKLNTKILELKLKIHAMVDMRIHGAPTQKIHQITQNLPGPPKGQGAGDLKTLVQKGDMETIRKRIHEIEKQTKQIEGRVAPVPVTVEVNDGSSEN